MNVYTTDKIRNVVLLGHGGCGKTSLVEAMAYLSGITSRMGKVSDGNTVSDFGKEEQKRQISISTSVIPIEWEGIKINILKKQSVQQTQRLSLFPEKPAWKWERKKRGKYAKSINCPVLFSLRTWT